MTVGSGANRFDRLVGTHGVVHHLGPRACPEFCVRGIA
jgi:hypothetical protein